MSVGVMRNNCCSDIDVACCSAFPPEFVRMRYFYGQPLGPVDFFDEQAYHAGKMRFHNRRLHGAGVLCGLRVERFVFPQYAPAATPTTVLRVRRGAAIDSCGREIIVGTDQCIDVNAWFQANRKRPELTGLTLPGDFPLCIGLRYRECPSDAMPAPRDPCGCDGGGCEFGRVRESFELTLLTEPERASCLRTQDPGLDEVRRSISQAASGLTLTGPRQVMAAIHRVIGAACPDPSEDAWLCLACLRFKVDADGNVTDLTDVDNEGDDRLSLLPTHLLQELFGEALVHTAPTGPSVTNVVFTGNGATAGDLRLDINLVVEGTPPAAVPLAENTFQSGFISASRLDETNFQWQPAPFATAVFDAASTPPNIRITWNAGLAADTRYRVTLDPPFATPIVDRRMRALTPARLQLQFRLINSGGVLQAATSLF